MSDLIGDMNHVVEVLVNNPVQSGTGNKDAYTVLLTTRGRKKRTGGNRTQNFSDINGYQVFELTIRKRSALQLTQSMKVRIDGILHTIHTWDDTDKMYLRMYVYQKNA